MDKPLVSVLVRTCGRPKVLYECINSICHQTYSNIEICIAEDGAPQSEAFIRKKFPHVNIKYQALGEKRGRSAAGNLALSMATGQYFNFLDDDDLFYENHIEVLMEAVLQHPEYALFYAKADEAAVHVQNTDPFVYETVTLSQPPFRAYSRENLLLNNMFPIQAVLFKRELYDALGGFDEKLDMLEDWELWLKYAQTGAFFFTDHTTSVYKVPSDAKSAAKRESMLHQNENAIRSIYASRFLAGRVVPDGRVAVQNKNMRYALDCIEREIGNLKIMGWCCVKDIPSSALSFFAEITDSRGRKFMVPAFGFDRADIAKKYNNKAYLKSGFCVSVPWKGADVTKVKMLACYGNVVYKNRNSNLWQKLFGFNK